ncbi:MAG: DNA recombination protein RmuC [Clostridia bacterium]|nr:DNA recombination protein RmuC [Clostridia bacterium]
MEGWIAAGCGVVGVVLLLILLLRPQQGARQIAEAERRLTEQSRQDRKETLAALQNLQAQLGRFQAESLRQTGEERDKLYRSLAEQSQKMSDTLASAVEKLQQSNEQKLEQMRQTVDEKLTATLTQRLDSSFKTVGEQLSNVYRSLGEMKELAGGVSDLQRVLTNVKARGTWAEVQLGNLLEQTLTPDEYLRNVSVKNNGEAVEYAVRIPSRADDGTYVLLPIDSKFPQEDYLRLCDAADRADKAAVDAAAKALEAAVRRQAQTIASLYISVPATTDFAILFLPTEGLYAEVLRRPGLAEEVQNKYRVMICGPTTITAFLNTLRMGFRTIALDKRAAEVWRVLGAARQQYEKFEAALAKVRRKIDEAGTTLDEAQKRNGLIRRKLNGVDRVDGEQAQHLLALTPEEAGTDDADD